MTDAHPIIGWEGTGPVPDQHRFSSSLSARGGRLFMEDLDLAGLLVGSDNQLGRRLPSPLEIVYLPLIGHRIRHMKRVFSEIRAAMDYDGAFHYTYASKANAAEEVIRTTLRSGAHHETSSGIDVDIARIMIKRGLLTPDKYIICNGFKPAGHGYAAKIIRLRARHQKTVPVVEDFGELPPLIESGLTFDVGLRLKTYGDHTSIEEFDAANSRFGLPSADLWKAADSIAAAPNLKLTLLHSMVGSQILDEDAFVARLRPGIKTYARLRRRHPDLQIFNFGGGMPAPMTLDFRFDYRRFARLLLTTIQEVCTRYGVPVPDVMGEFGRHTTAEHGAHVFRVISAKENSSKLPWYIIDGSIMSSFPDSWALQEHFVVLPLNRLDTPFRRVQLGGITCDSDDVYPPKTSRSPLYLPEKTDGLYVGFFNIGAYQEMLGGVGGVKHCVVPEAIELIVDRAKDDEYQFEILSGQTEADVLKSLGYDQARSTS